MAGKKRLSYADRVMIEKMNEAGLSYEAIATAVNCSGMTVYREIRRGGGRENYKADVAQKQLR